MIGHICIHHLTAFLLLQTAQAPAIFRLAEEARQERLETEEKERLEREEKERLAREEEKAKLVEHPLLVKKVRYQIQSALN